MVIELERPTTSNASPFVHPRATRRPYWVQLGLYVTAFIIILAHLINLGRSQEFQLQFKIASDVPFKEDIPRTAHLIIVDQNRNVQTLEDNRFASAFIDRRNSFWFTMPNVPISRIFFSPAPPSHFVEVTSILAIGNHKSVEIPLDHLVPNRQVEIITQVPNRVTLKTLPGPEIPLLELQGADTLNFVARKPWVSTGLSTAFALIAVSSLLLLSFVKRPSLLNSWRRISPFQAAQFGVAAALIFTMAAITKFNAHPDEYLHFETAKYFVTHWFPPALDARVIEPSFSHYGVSYLQDLDTAYFVIGKLVAVVAPWLTSLETAARFSNVLLFVLLAAWLLYRLPGSLCPAILLISPQIWYLFSYVNADSWGLALSFVIVVQLSDQHSLLNKYLQGKDWRTGSLGGLGFATLLALLLMAKQNYYLFLPFIALIVFWQSFLWVPKTEKIRLVRKWAAIVIVAVALYLPLRIGHEAVNHFRRPQLQTEQAEKFAAPGFKPSEIASGEGAQRLALRSRGVQYSDLLFEYDWVKQSFQSFCGVYQWMSLNGPATYYRLVGGLYLILLVLATVRICSLSWKDALLSVLVGGLALLVISASVYHSWTGDFQPQGRYLFPILPMIGFLLHRYRESLSSPVFNLLFGCLFACSVYSFVLVALKDIPK